MFVLPGATCWMRSFISHGMASYDATGPTMFVPGSHVLSEERRAFDSKSAADRSAMYERRPARESRHGGGGYSSSW